MAICLNIIPVILAPIIAVIIGQWLQNRAENRKDKMQIFKTLMTARIYGWTVESVHAQNIIDIVFAKDKKVILAWRRLREAYNVVDPNGAQLNKIEIEQHKLIEAIADSLGYKNSINWEVIQNPYIPIGMYYQLEQQKNQQQSYNSFINNVNQMMNLNHDNESTEKDSSTEKKTEGV